MQALQNLKQTNDQRFDCLDKRWGQVEQALRLQNQERKEDINLLRERIQDRTSLSQNLQSNKAKILKGNLEELLNQVSQSKQNLEDCFSRQAEFRLSHLDKKNCFIQAYNQTAEDFATRVDEYSKARVREISGRLESIDQANHEATAEAVRLIKQEKIAQAHTFFNGEKQRFATLLSKTRIDTAREIDQMRASLREYNKKKEQSDSKLQIMIAALGAQLCKLQEVECKQGEITYDCLLKLVEDACSRIQYAQYK